MTLSERELQAIEQQFEDGLTSLQVVGLFRARGLRLSEASFRKYVQLGLLPRSRRVGRKGLHRGSCGLYPATTIRRLNAVRKLMERGHSLEEIQRAFLRFQSEIESLERGLSELLIGFEREIRAPHFDLSRQRELSRELVSVKKSAGELVRRIVGIERELARPEVGSPASTSGGTTDGAEIFLELGGESGRPDDWEPSKSARKVKSAAGGRDGRAALHR